MPSPISGLLGDMLVNMPNIGLGTGQLHKNLFEALSVHPEEDIRKLVDTPFKQHETAKPIHTTNGQSHLKIPAILREALEIQ